MSTGISISSINRIKELAEEKKYAEALEILDTQNLDKSINPQFLRISGEIFRENKRYYDSRRILIKSHEMAPQGTRIISELIQLYLELGYFTRANKYYEQYLFYSTNDDTRKDYVEYIMKKATGGDIKELASILIPILERMPEDKWNFEAVLLYDKLDRKDKALEEAQHILENYKESQYIKPILEYIDDKLDVDEYFYVYPKEEVDEDKELYGDLIEHEDKVLEADHYRMYPPEAKIIVEVEDKDAVDTKPVKEKKQKKKRTKRDKNSEGNDIDEITGDESKPVSESKTEDHNNTNKNDDSAEQKNDKEDGDNHSSEEDIKKEREEVLDRILAKKLDTDSIRKSAKSTAQNLSEDTKKAREQVKKVTEVVRDNVQKATDTLGDAVGTTKAFEKPAEEFMDGIIESVLEPPKKSVGQVVMNEELDALIPDSLEAMSPDEIKELETKKEEQEKIELEALEASVLIEDKKRRKKIFSFDKKNDDIVDDDQSETEDNEQEDVIVIDANIQNESIVSVSFDELKERFLSSQDEEEEEEKPLENLGFMSVVQSDVDGRMEDEVPDAADILHRMIDNKEYYTGEDSRGFESKASYENHGFEVDNYEFNDYINIDNGDISDEDIDVSDEFLYKDDTIFKVEDIYTQNTVIEFEDIAPEVTINSNNNPIQESEVDESPEPEWVDESEAETSPEPETEPEPIVETEAEPEPIVETEAEPEWVDEPVAEASPDYFVEDHFENTEEDLTYDYRENLRIRIVLTEKMVQGLLDLKESR